MTFAHERLQRGRRVLLERHHERRFRDHVKRLRWPATAGVHLARAQRLGGEHDRHRRAFVRPASAGSSRSRLPRAPGVSDTAAITPGSILHQQAQIEAPALRPASRAARRRAAPSGRPNGGPRRPSREIDRSAATEAAVGPSPAPRPMNVSWPDRFRLDDQRVQRAADVAPADDRARAATGARASRRRRPSACRSRDQLDPIAELAGQADVVQRDLLDALDAHVLVSPGAQPKAMAARMVSLCAASKPPTSMVGSASA